MLRAAGRIAGRVGWDGRVKDHRERRVGIVGIGIRGSESECVGYVLQGSHGDKISEDDVAMLESFVDCGAHKKCLGLPRWCGMVA